MLSALEGINSLRRKKWNGSTLSQLRVYESMQYLAPPLLGLIMARSFWPSHSNEFGLRVAFLLLGSLVQNMFIATFNDFCDRSIDGANPRKKIRTLSESGYVWILSGLMGIYLLSLWFLPLRVVLISIGIFACANLYSLLRSFRVQHFSMINHFIFGVGITFMGALLFKSHATLFDAYAALFFGMASMLGGLSNDLADFEVDRKSGLKSLSHSIGQPRSLAWILCFQGCGFVFFSLIFNSPWSSVGVFLGGGWLIYQAFLVKKENYIQRQIEGFRRSYRIVFSTMVIALIIHEII